MRLRLLLLLVAALPLRAQSLRGVTLDADRGIPVTGATIRVLPGPLGTLTDHQGRFSLAGLSPGSYQLLVTSVGYGAWQQPVLIGKTEAEALTIRLRTEAVQLNQQTVVTAARTETEEFKQPEFTTVLNRRELDRRVPRTVPEALLGATGVWLQKTNHGGGSPFVRGLTGQQTLLLVDGIRLNNATFRSGPNQYLNTLDPQLLDRLEVVRSSGSVLYGSDALGGVIQVLSKTPEFRDQGGWSGNVFGKVITSGMEYSGRTELGYQSNRLALLGGFAYRKFGDLRAGKGLGLQRPTGYSQLSGDLKARLRIGSRYVLTAAYQDLEQDSVPVYHKVKLENFRYNQFDPQRRLLAYARLEGYVGQRYLRSWQLTASRQRMVEGRQSQKNGSPTAVYERDETTTHGLTLQAQSELASFWQAQSGLEWYHDRVGSTRQDQNRTTGQAVDKRGLYPDGASQTSLALYSNHTLSWNRLTATLGSRYSSYRISIPEKTLGEATIRPSALVGNIGLSFALHPNLRLVGTLQSAFRAPNIDDMGTLGIVDFRYEVPNANLKPERGFNKELGLKLRTSRFSASLLAYHNRLTNFINRVRAGRDSLQGYPVFLKQNTATAFIRGLEAEAEWALAPNWLAYGSLVYTYGQNTTANEPFRRIPPLNGRLGLTYQPTNQAWIRLESLLAGAQTRLARGDQDDNRIPKGGTPGWEIISLSGGYRWKQLSLTAELHNLFDKAYRTHGSGVDGMGRSAALAVRMDF